jgi:cobyrinic acid a,c-diamide synthase
MTHPLSRPLPRLVIAGLSGDAGKTLVSVGLALLLRDRGVPVRGFKKGPDYIDAAWLAWATGEPARNLDTWLMGPDLARAAFVEQGIDDGLNLIEGNRGIFDGIDEKGTHSTAELAKLLHAPVILVVDATKVTRTAAACVLGCQALDPDVRFAGVVLNQVAGPRHERVLRDAIESTCELPVLGAVPKASSQALLPGRHLGLLTPEEHAIKDVLESELRDLLRPVIDVDRLVAIAQQAPRLEAHAFEAELARSVGRELGRPREGDAGPVTIGYLLDSAFTFYYPENLEALEASGATLLPISALAESDLPRDLGALYIGGGFPETHAAALTANVGFLRAIRHAVGRGLPIYAECGGLMLLSQAIWWQQRKYPMAGVLPFDVEMMASPQGHGYTQLVVDGPNPFYEPGASIRGHEFHYSRVLNGAGTVPTSCNVVRGTGCFPGRDGVVVNQAFACYTHVHALATPEWAAGMIAAARRYNDTARRGDTQ